MKKWNFPLVCDLLFYTIGVWFLSVGILRYFRLPLALSLAVCTLFSLAVGILLFLLFSRRKRKKQLSKAEQLKKDALLLHLALEKEERVRALFLEAFLAEEKRAHCKEKVLEVEEKICIPRFTLQPLSADEAAKLLREYGEKNFTILCNRLSPEGEKLCRDFGISTLCAEQVFDLFIRTNTYPQTLICGEIPRKTAKTKFRAFFSKRNARPFFTSGILLLVMSLFTFFPIYYLLSGGALLITAILVRALGKEEIEQK